MFPLLKLIKRVLGRQLIDCSKEMAGRIQDVKVLYTVIWLQRIIGRLLPVPWYVCGWKINRIVELSILRKMSSSRQIKIQQIRKEEWIVLSLPTSGNQINMDAVFRPLLGKINPEFSLLEISGGYAFDDGKNIAVITGDGTLIKGVATSMRKSGGRHPIQSKMKLPKVRHLRGRVLLLSTWGAYDNYYHWIAELIPKALGLCAAGININSFDYILVNGTFFKYQKEALEVLGVAAEKLICTGSDSGKFVMCERLCVPTHTCYLIPARWALDLLRGKFLPSGFFSAYKRLYISRADASYRRVINEDEVMAILTGYGFEKVTLADLSIGQQAALFSSAAAIISVHGAGLTNLAFAARGCKVLELFASSYVMPFYWGIASTMELDYTYLVSSVHEPQNKRSVSADLTVDLCDLKSVISGWGL